MTNNSSRHLTNVYNKKQLRHIAANIGKNPTLHFYFRSSGGCNASNRTFFPDLAYYLNLCQQLIVAYSYYFIEAFFLVRILGYFFHFLLNIYQWSASFARPRLFILFVGFDSKVGIIIFRFLKILCFKNEQQEQIDDFLANSCSRYFYHIFDSMILGVYFQSYYYNSLNI